MLTFDQLLFPFPHIIYETQSDAERARAEAASLQEKLEKSQGEVYRLKAKLENAQGEQESLRQEMERVQNSVQRIHAERDKVSPINSITIVLTYFYFIFTKKQTNRPTAQVSSSQTVHLKCGFAC